MKTIPRIQNIYRPEATRIEDYKEVERKFNTEELTIQASRCMDCGIPFCHGLGCPLGNVIPEMNDAVKHENWKLAWEILSETSNMPEFTSRVCPALCENACTKNIENVPVMIRQLEKSVVENAFEFGYVKQITPETKTGKSVAVVGAGPSGLYMAFELFKKGHNVTVYEKRKYAGGLLRYGIPDFKLEKNVIERRIDILKASGIEFQFNTEIGKDISAEYLKKKYDATVLAIGT
ncbi:MAG: NAD(P)-binding protein, partial [Candidatus Mucispirillum faecigallinarum]|nr:NAD(P)-binding protein [Candidatus Mucispirillum faecigallinarum]